MALKIKAELLFLMITILVCITIMWPIYKEYETKYLFYNYNISFIILFVTLTRYIFLLRYTPFSHYKPIKIGLIFICIPLFLFLIDGMYEFQRFLDEEGFESISQSLHSQNMAKYTRYQYLFFATGALVTLFMTPFRMIISLWRQHNKGTI